VLRHHSHRAAARAPLTATLLGRVGALVLSSLLAACAAVSEAPVSTVVREIVYPPPPDEARFVYERTIYSSADIIAEESSTNLRRALTGEQRIGEPLSKPYAIAAFRGKLYVSDTAARFVRVLDLPSGRYSRIGDEDGNGGLVKPVGLDVDGQGNLYVADITQKVIIVYGPTGNFLRRIGGAKWFERLSSVTVDAAGTRLYAVDIGGVSSDQHQVRVFDAVTGAHLQDIGKRGSGPGEFNLPRDVAIGKDGRLYVVDGGNFRVVVFDRNGRYLHSFGSIGKQYGQFARPKEIASDAEGNVYVVDTAFGNFQIFNADGELLLFVGDRSERDAPGKYMLPSGIAIDLDGRVYLVDQWFRKIDVFRPASMKPEQGFAARVKPAR
jgi:DNA-binding beta-propeller fold protein YncE